MRPDFSLPVGDLLRVFQMSLRRRTKRILETSWLSKILWFLFTTGNSVLAIYTFSGILDYFDVWWCPLPAPKPLGAAAFCTFYLGIPTLDHGSFSSHAPWHLGQVLLTLSSMRARCWAFCMECFFFPEMSTKALVLWFPHETSHGLSFISSRYLFLLLGTTLW